jgi:hypothetical protein
VRPAFLLALGLLLGPVAAHAQESGAHSTTPLDERPLLPTPTEAADYLAYTDFDAMVDFLSRLAADAPELSVDTVALLSGETAPGEQREPALLLLGLRRQRVDEEPGHDVRTTVLIIGSQHGDEQSGKEATLAIVRDLAIGPLNPLLDDLDVYAVPMPNPWGTATGQRENARGRDLNRDHTRLETPSASALHAIFARLNPAVVIDVHELGMAAYDAEIGLPTHPNADSSLIKFGRYRIMPYVANELAKSGFSFHEYVTATPDPGSADEGVERYFTYGPLLASYARNAFALRGAISMLFEAASSREIQDLARRTEVHTVALRAALEVIASAATEIRDETAAARRRMEEPYEGAWDDEPALVLRATYETDPEQPVLTWLVLEPEGINTGSTDRWRPAIRVSLAIDRPAGYLIPASEHGLVAALLRHGFELAVLEQSRTLRVGRYPLHGLVAELDSSATVAAPGAPASDTSALERADASVAWSVESVPAGTFYIDMRQPASLLAAAILEPWSQDSWYGTGAETVNDEGTWYPVARVESPIETGTRAVPTASGDGILGGP